MGFEFVVIENALEDGVRIGFGRIGGQPPIRL
jgi:hypothetical protein